MAVKRGAADESVENFNQLVNRYENMLSASEDVLPTIWTLGDDPSESDLDTGAELLRKAIGAAQGYLPLAYQEAFVAPLLRNLEHVVRSTDDRFEMHKNALCLAMAVAGHALPRSSPNPSPVLSPLRQFLAVVSNLYRSFLGADKRRGCRLPLPDPGLPPLVAFHQKKDSGPAVLTGRMNRLLCGSDVAVVILPTIYRRTPLSWAALAHETCGHGVLQADPGLLPDLVAGVRTLFGGGPLAPGQKPDEDQALGLLWSYWVEETASDVYGLMNIGPAFALNLAAFMAAKRRSDANPGDVPILTLPAGADRGDPGTPFDLHPPDLLRLHVAIGVIENLVGLSPARVKRYVGLLRRLSLYCRPVKQGTSVVGSSGTPGRARSVTFVGRVEVDHDRWAGIEMRNYAIEKALESARRVGAYVATTRLPALGGATIQDVETWDDADEHAACTIRDLLLDPLHAPVFVGADADNPALAGFKRPSDGKFPDDLAAALQALDDDDAIEVIDRLTSGTAGDVIRALGLSVVESAGDDAQLLAGATLAALERPTSESFRWINRRIAYALNRSHRYDPIMGIVETHRMFSAVPSPSSLPPRERLRDPLEEAEKTGPAARVVRPAAPGVAAPVPAEANPSAGS